MNLNIEVFVITPNNSVITNQLKYINLIENPLFVGV